MSDDITAFVYGALMAGMESNGKNVAARLPQYNVTFRPIAASTLLAYFEPAFAALEPAEPGEILTEATSAHGVLCTMSQQSWLKLIIHETSYEPQELQGPFLDPTSGKEIPTTGKVFGLLLSSKSKARMNTSPNPSARYSALLTQGAQKFGFPRVVVSRYQNAERLGSKKSKILIAMMFAPLFQPFYRWMHAKVSPAFAVIASFILFFGLYGSIIYGLLTLWRKIF